MIFNPEHWELSLTSNGWRRILADPEELRVLLDFISPHPEWRQSPSCNCGVCRYLRHFDPDRPPRTGFDQRPSFTDPRRRPGRTESVVEPAEMLGYDEVAP